MNAFEEIDKVFEEAIKKHPDDHDSVKAEMVAKGIPFSSVTRIFNDMMIRSGRALSKWEKEQMTNAILGKGGFKTEKAFANKVDTLMNKMNVSHRSASAIIRAYAKKHGRTYYKPPVDTTPPRKSFMKQFCEYLEANPNATKDQVQNYLNDGTATYIKRNLNLYMEVWTMLQNVLRNKNG